MDIEKKNHIGKKGLLVLAIIFVGLIAFFVGMLVRPGKEEEAPKPSVSPTNPSDAALSELSPENYQLLSEFAKEHDLALSEWPGSLLLLLEKNPEAKDFVLNYPLKKDMEQQIDLSEYLNAAEVPLFLQWDQRWGYKEYGNTVMGISGCGHLI